MESIAREGMTSFDVAAEISQEMKKQALVARVNGEVVELWRPLHEGDRVEILTFEDEDGRRAQEQINQLAMREYEQTGTLSSARLCEAVTEYERKIAAHVLPER